MTIKIDLENITEGSDNRTNFRSQLIRLIFKADLDNKSRIRLGYPNTVRAVEYFKATGEVLDLPDY